MSAPDVIRKILVLRFSSLGDIVMATPLVRALRKAYPNAQIDMAVRGDFLELIRCNPHLDRKIALPRKSGWKGLMALSRDINREGYDLVYDAHRSLRTRALMPLIRARHKRYYDKHYLRRSAALTLKIPLLKDKRRMLERYIEPLEPFGVHFDSQGPEVFIDEPTKASAEKKVPVARPVSGCLIGFIPSAQWPGKRWPLDRFREVLVRLLDQTTHSGLVFGGPEDDFCKALCEGLPESRVTNSQGKLTIGESAALLARCDFVVANDTGLMHVADALGIPSVLMLGPTSAEMGCLPFHPLSRVLQHELWCRPCSKNGEAPCIRARRYCLERTTVDDVFQAALNVAEALNERGNA